MSSAGSGDQRRKRRPKGFVSLVGFYLTSPLRWVSEAAARRRARKARQRALERGVEPAGSGGGIRRVFTAPIVAMEEGGRRLIGGLAQYATTRNGIYLLQGLPAILVFIGTVVLGILAFSYQPADLIEHYKKEAADLRKEFQQTPKEDVEKRKRLLDETSICYERWARLEPRNDEPKYECAVTMGEYPERQQQALDLMRQLAPYNRSGGNLKAHEWLALFHTSLARKETNPAQQKLLLDMAETHWMRVLILNPSYVMAHVNLANLYMGRARFDRAEWHFRYLLDRDLDKAVNLSLAEVYLRTGRPEEARRAAAAARDYFSGRLDTGQTEAENLQFRLSLARALTILKKYASDSEGIGAIDVLEDGYRLAPNKLYKTRLAEIHMERMADLPADAFEERLRLYDDIIRYDPYNIVAFQYLITGLRKDNPLYQQTQDKIDEMIVRTSSATFFFLLSNKYLQEKNYDLAKRHLETALQINSNLLVACNNLAYLLVFRTNPPDYDRALRIIDSGLKYAINERLPPQSVATFHDTRGQILVAKGEYDKGIMDLEKAVDLGFGRSIESIDTHKALMRAYQAVGKSALANEQSRIIKIIEDEAAKQKKEPGPGQGSPAAP